MTVPPPHKGVRQDRELPRHVAIIMDGNGRWAQRRRMPRFAGHRAGLKAAREIIETCGGLGIEVLSLFAFSSENWRRPRKEVELLLDLFLTSLQEQTATLHQNQVRVRFIGDRSAFSHKLIAQIEDAEQLTAGNTGLKLVIAANYGGRWDIMQAVRSLADAVQRGERPAVSLDNADLEAHLSLADLPEPDLFIRTGGEQRISNFFLWQLAYTELYFTEALWPDFGRDAFDAALDAYAKRQRRFGLTGEQVEQIKGA